MKNPKPKTQNPNKLAKGASRGAWARLDELRLRCATGVLPTASILAAHFGVSPKSIFRDIEELRNMGYGIEFRPRLLCYRVTLPPRQPMTPLAVLPLHLPTRTRPPEEAI